VIEGNLGGFEIVYKVFDDSDNITSDNITSDNITSDNIAKSKVKML